MKYIILISWLFFCFSPIFAQEENLKLWYRQPANAAIQDNKNGWVDDQEWLKALPLGNGNIGAMVFGDINLERVQLNEKTLWSGSNSDNDNPDASKYLNEIRRLLFEGKFREATELTNKTQVCKGAGSGFGNGANVPYGSYQTLGDLWIDFGKKSPYQHYNRELNLEEAVVYVSYEQDGILFTREYFTSAPDNVLLIKMMADKPESINFTIKMNRPEKFTTLVSGNELIMKGTLDDGNGGPGMEYIVRSRIKLKGGEIQFLNDSVAVSNADEVVLYLSTSTDYLPEYPMNKGKNYEKISEDELNNAFMKSYYQLKNNHIADYQNYFKRVSLSLSDTAIADTIPTDERLKIHDNQENSNFLNTLFFQYGRYLLISSSRENTLPSNLQGIWANKIQTPWNCDYHTNINVQMNYWPAENTNLGDIHLSLIRFIQGIEKPATKSAKIQFGANGWCINPIVNVWGFTSPGEDPSWGLTSGASGWICQMWYLLLKNSLIKKVSQIK